MDHYDEDLFENPFFRNMSKNKQIFDHITCNRWMVSPLVCVHVNGRIQLKRNLIRSRIRHEPRAFKIGSG